MVSRESSPPIEAVIQSGALPQLVRLLTAADTRIQLESSWAITNIASGASLREGGHNYQALVRKTARKPIRVFLQDGANDLDNVHGNWPLANQALASSLAWAGYDYRFDYGKGFHNNRHGRAIFPDTLRWLWRDWKTTAP